MNIALPRHTGHVAKAILSAVLLLGLTPTLISPLNAVLFALAVVVTGMSSACPYTVFCGLIVQRRR
jgi:hypothetical protein